MAVRLKDIARDVGVSTITVSKVLHNHPDISEETRERVLRRMKELNYQPNLSARALVTGKTGAIGFIVPDLVHPFFAEVAKGLAATLRDKGYDLVIASSEEAPDIESKAIEQMLARRVDALIIASVQRDAKSFARVAERKVPYVLIDRQFAGLRANFVGVDDEEAGVLATEHLIAAGCRRIAHIRGPKVSTATGRARGYRRSLARYGMEVRAEYVAVEETGDESGEASGYRAMGKLLQLKPRPDGVFCYNDPSAMGAMQAILDADLKIPEDIAIIGCGNVRYSQFLRVPLSSVDQRSPEIGSRAGAMAITLIEAKSAPKPASILLELSVVARASTARRQKRTS
ncbi:MAG: LacI family DNA-binding transcriptional regulator [Bryobacteraceae bacterium]